MKKMRRIYNKKKQYTVLSTSIYKFTRKLNICIGNYVLLCNILIFVNIVIMLKSFFLLKIVFVIFNLIINKKFFQYRNYILIFFYHNQIFFFDQN